MDATTGVARLLQGFATTLKKTPGLMGVSRDSSPEVPQRHTGRWWANLPLILSRPQTEVTPALATTVRMTMWSDFKIPRPALRPHHISRECSAAGECADVPAASIITAQTRTLGSHILRAPRAPSRRASKTDRCKDDIGTWVQEEEECRARRRIERFSSSPVGVVRLTREHDERGQRMAIDRRDDTTQAGQQCARRKISKIDNPLHLRSFFPSWSTDNTVQECHDLHALRTKRRALDNEIWAAIS